ncbi:MAG: hypothetical protein GAS50_10760 [Desulfobacterales bacterium]|jgi:hypothetical protein|nr:hypothetical protein [Desulfobacterales bacterium]
MMKEVEFVIPFGLEDRYRHYHLRIKGHIIDFSLQYETFIDGEWLPVVRYDTSHGFAHRDLINIKGQKRKTPLFITDKNDALTFAESDINDNWQLYKERFLKEAKKDD